MAVLIDASILIEAERGRLALKPHVAQRPEEAFFLSVITASELLHGVHRAVQPEVQAKRSAFVEAILARFPLLPVDLATACAHAQVWATLAAAGDAERLYSFGICELPKRASRLTFLDLSPRNTPVPSAVDKAPWLKPGTLMPDASL